MRTQPASGAVNEDNSHSHFMPQRLSHLRLQLSKR